MWPKNDRNFLLLRPYHGEHRPKVPVTPEDIVLQRVLQKRECMSIITKKSMMVTVFSIKPFE
jgi:hypothetical protein